MNDYSYKFHDFSLEPYAVIRAKAPSFNTRQAQDLEVSSWFMLRSGDGKKAIVRGLKSFPIQFTKAKLKALRPLIFVIDEVMKDPDEVYLYSGANFLYYTYFKFYADRAVMIDVKFNIDTQMIIDRVKVLKPEEVDTKRKGTLYYDSKRYGKATTF